ncbi:transporter substrate-binding domain-containing protein [Pseudomonas stutzeri]|uniref:ABC transporter substrate-binding protein n=1 Tax=Stutzerimonas stutzeri TaxID=316 RepID=A0A2N8RYH9_STUST|nr:transporter substrate-binding domain-containing protein [Stutzerimonas stutzeri]MCQ4295965.1 transporter substrate-binding domain-containing protein [Stutzerimonas stutzeri]PNF79434.1 ABC transporter substrate-binding protein [Stutzerimonas stutzeri]
MMHSFAWIALLIAFLGFTAQAEPLRVVTEETAYSYLLEGQVAGTASRVVEATLQRAGLNDYQVSLYPWARAYDMALREPGVLIYLIARTSEREELFRWVGEVMRIEYHFYRLHERDDIEVPDLDAAKAYRIGVLREDVRHQFLQANGFTKIVVTAHNSDNFKRLLNGQVDLLPMPEQDMLTLCNEAGVDPSRVEKAFSPHTSTQLYMAYSRQTDDDIVLRTQAAFEHLHAEGEVARIMAGQP